MTKVGQQSTQLRLRSDATRIRLTEIGSELEALNQQLAGKALAEDPGSKGIARLVEQRGKLLQESELLQLRLDGLEHQHATAEQAEAAERLAAITVELDELTEKGERETAQFAEAITYVTRLAREAGTRRQHAATMMDEARYLATLHDLESPSFAAVPMPNHEEVEQLARLIRDAITTSTNNRWNFTHDTLLRERAEEAAKHAPRPQLQVEDHRELDSVLVQREWDRREEERKRNVVGRWYPEGQSADSRVKVEQGGQRRVRRHGTIEEEQS